MSDDATPLYDLVRDSRDCSGRFPCIPCQLFARRVGWPPPVEGRAISFCELERLKEEAS